MTTSRVDQFALSVSLNGNTLGIFDKRTGGDVDSNDTKYRPGAMASEVSLGGPTTTANVVVSRSYVLERDHAQAAGVIAQVGKGRVRIIQQPLDADGNAWGKPMVWSGVLKRATYPEHDSTGTAASMVELEVSVDGTVAVNV